MEPLFFIASWCMESARNVIALVAGAFALFVLSCCFEQVRLFIVGGTTCLFIGSCIFLPAEGYLGGYWSLLPALFILWLLATCLCYVADEYSFSLPGCIFDGIIAFGCGLLKTLSVCTIFLIPMVILADNTRN